jgi:alpha-D-xyloside xylohydrolase
MFWKLLITFVCMMTMAVFAQSNKPKEFIRTRNKTYVDVQTAAVTVRLSIYDNGIMRVQAYKGDGPEKRWNPAVIAEPKNIGFGFTDGESEAVMKTAKMKVVVIKASGQVKFYDAAGKLLTQTAADGGCRIQDDADGGVSQKFLMSQGEHIYGVGQYVNGLPYVNGTGCTLVQTNMEDAGHVIMSDRGYGMFWNNPSAGQFDAFGNQELLSDKYVRTEDGKPGFAAMYYPSDSVTKQQHYGKYVATKITKTIDISPGNAESTIDIMQSDFDIAATGKKKADPDQGGASLLYRGTLHTPKRTGWYYFNIGNAGRGVRFVIDGERVVERRIPHDYSWNCGRKWLEGDKDYSFELYFSHFTKDNAVLQLYWNHTGNIYKQYTWKSNCWKTSDYFVFVGDNYDEIMNGLYKTTGKVSILPKWSLGYIHCQALPFWRNAVDGFKREGFLSLVRDYRQKQIPCDVLVQDFQWWTVMGSHIFRPDCYPDFASRLQKVHNENFKLMISIWPIFLDIPASGYKEKLTDADLKNKKEMKDKGLLVHNCVDFVKPQARKIFWRQVADSLYNDKICVDAFWLDADEGGAKDPRYGNAYPMLDKMAFDEGARATYPDKRLFLLGRSMYPGSQRFDTAMWSGDVGNDFWTLERQVSAGLSASVCGMPYWTTDIGGFGGGFCRDADYANDKNPENPVFREVVARWFQYGMFCPIFRVHRADNDSAPWFYGDEVEKIIADTIRFRYRLMPYVYSMTKRTREDGYNPMRPLFMDFGSDKNTLDITQQFMYGPAFLVCPVTKAMYKPYQPSAKATKDEFVSAMDGYLRTTGGKEGLRGEYFEGEYFEKLLFTRIDEAINFDGNFDSKELPSEHFSIRWTGKLVAPESATYTIKAGSDDGLRVWIDGSQIVNSWQGQPFSYSDYPVYLTEGQHDIKIEYFQGGWDKKVALGWVIPGKTKPEDKPVITTDVKDMEVYLPAGADWYDFKTGEKLPGGRKIDTPAPLNWMPLFVRAGSIVPMGKVIQSTVAEKQTEIELRIYPGADCEFTLYDDDGVSYDYEKGAFAEIPLHWDDSARKLTIGKRKGSFESMPPVVTFNPILVRLGKGIGALKEYSGDETVEYTGKKIEVRLVR